MADKSAKEIFDEAIIVYQENVQKELSEALGKIKNLEIELNERDELIDKIQSGLRWQLLLDFPELRTVMGYQADMIKQAIDSILSHDKFPENKK